MKEEIPLKKLKNELSQLEKEFKNYENQNERYKVVLSEEVKNFNKKEIFQTKKIKKSFTIWERLMRVLKMN